MKVPYLSATRLKMAKDCTLAYEYQYDPKDDVPRVLKKEIQSLLANTATSLGNIVHGAAGWRLANAPREWKSAFTQVWPIDETLWRMGFKASIRCWFGVLQRWCNSFVVGLTEEGRCWIRVLTWSAGYGKYANPYVLDNGVPIYGFIDLIVETKTARLNWWTTNPTGTKDPRWSRQWRPRGIYLSWLRRTSPTSHCCSRLRCFALESFQPSGIDKKIENFKSYQDSIRLHLGSQRRTGNHWRFFRWCA